MKLAAPMAALVAAGFAVGPAAAQESTTEQSGQRIAEIIVYGNDPCPRSTDDEVVVCARRPESERYRIPEKYRPSGTYQQKQAWANKARSIERVGRTGIQSCSPVGPAGYTGCLEQMIRGAREEADEAREAQTAPPE
jgi:hypothetical protein